MTAPNETIRAIAVARSGKESGAERIARIISHIAVIFFLVDFSEVFSKSLKAKSANICEAT